MHTIIPNLIVLISVLAIEKTRSNNLLKDDHITNLLNVDINTNLIEFERIANTIQLMPSGGMVSKKRRLMTVKLAMRSIIDGIEGDFLETVRYFL